MASEYIKEKAKKSIVEKGFVGKAHHFNVKTQSGSVHEVSVEVRCDCRFMGVQGIPNGKICSHIVAALSQMLEE
jgi:hypothetical protein